MQATLHGAFGLICSEINISPNDKINLPLVTNNVLLVGSSLDIVCLQTKGHGYYEHLATGNTVEVVPGELYYANQWVPGEYKINLYEDIQYFCINNVDNPEHYPVSDKLSVFKLLANETVEIEQGKKLLLCTGSLDIEGKNYSGVNRIRFTTGNKMVTAIEDSYGMFINI